ncbi:MAG TPA: type IV secretion system DNA-binding domain-containing protein [Capsulimonadaceae bacterium]|jgi:hypothetical protein
MLSRLIESLLINIVNNPKGVRTLGRREKPKLAAQVEPSSDVVVVGHAIPVLPELITLSDAERRRHVYVLGATGSGKTNLLLRLIEADIAKRTNICVIDLRGDFVDRILPRLAASGDPAETGKKLLLVDLRDAEFSVGLNALSGDGDAYSRAFGVLAILKQHAESMSWGVQLEETLRNCLLALAETRWTILEIEPLLCNRSFRSEVLSQVTDQYARSFFGRYDQLSDDKQLSWSQPVLNKVSPLLAIPQLRHLLGQREGANLAEIVNDASGTVVLVSLAVDRLHQAAYLAGSLITSALQGAVMSRVDIPENRRVQTNFYIDEFETMASERFESIIAEGRRFGLGLCLSHQNLSQVPMSLRKALLNNVHTQFYFQTGASDAAEVAKELSSGETRETRRSVLISQDVGEAFLVRRGKPSTRVKVIRTIDGTADAEAVRTLRQASIQTFARPQEAVRLELAGRADRYSNLAGTPAAPSTPTYEIRHAKKDDFKPKRKL